MHTPLLANRLSRWLAVAAFGLLAAPGAHAQLAGPKTIPGSYATVALAITDLNTQGVGAGGVTFNIAPGYTETFASPTAGAITATGTAANPIIFQKSGAGANPKITAGVGTAALDAIISLAGSDYVTLDGLELAESAANTTAVTQMEFGIAMFRPSATDGCQNNTIRNCVVTLNKTNTTTFGIYGAASTAAVATSVAATAPSGANSGNKVNGNIITNSATGMYFTASTLTTLANYDQNNEVGVTAANQVYNFGTTATGWGIGGNYQNGFKVVNNVVNNTLNYNSATGTTSAVAASTVTSTLRGIYGNSAPSASIDITGNTITLASGTAASLMTGIDNGIGSTAASNTVNITGNTVLLSSATATTSTITGITNAASATTVNITGNTVSNCTFPAATTSPFTGINNSGTAVTANLNTNIVTNNTATGTGTMLLINGGSPTTLNMNGNTVTGNSKTPAAPAAGITMQCLTASTAAVTVNNNTVSNNTIVISGSSSSAATIYGYTDGSSPTSETLTSNTIAGLVVSGTSTGSHVVAGVRTNTSSTTVQVMTLNTISGLAVTGSGTGTVNGMLFLLGGGTASSYARNKIYDLSSVGTGAAVNGISISGGGTFPLANNLIGDLRAPAATGLTAVNGIQVSGSTGVNAYFNTINLSAASTGATFGTSGIYLSSTTPVVDLRNNIVVNKSTAAGTGLTAALRRVSATLTGYASTSNNNLYYAGTPSATQVLYYDGTTGYQTPATFKTAVAPRETNSVTEDVPFLSTTGTAPTFLHINPAVATQVESGGVAITGITTDFDGDTRTATPDLGADEGTFIALDISGPVITFAPLSNTSSTANRTLTATITDPSGVSTTTAPRLFYRKGTSGAFLSALATSISGSAYTFTLDYAALGGVAPGDAIQYYVVAQDAIGNVSSNTAGGTFSTNPATFNQYTILGTLSGVYYVGAGTSPDPTRTYTTLTAAAAAYNGNGMAGPVTFLLIDPTYSTAETFPIIFGSNVDASATNTLTVKPNTGVSSTITGSNATAILALNGTDYMTLDGSNGGTISGTDPRPSRNLTVANTNASTTSFVVLVTVPSATDNATNNTVRNLNAVGSGSLATQVGIAFLSSASGTGGNNNNVVQNNSVQATQYGIYSYGVSATVKNTGTVITQNDLNATGTSALGRVGIIVGFEDGIQITRNAIDGIVYTASGDVAGISAGFGLSYLASTFTGSEVTNATISRNNIGVVRNSGTYSAVGIGLSAATSGTSTIANNFISGVASNGTSGDFGVGIMLGGGTGSTTRVVFNSVSMTNPTPALTGGNYPGFALAVGGASPTVEIRNNILVNTQTTGSGNSIALGFAYAGTTGAYAGLTSSNNDFVVGTGSTFAVGQTGGLSTSGVLRTTLAALNTETGQDSPTTSKTIDPLFASATDLHVAAAGLNNAGVPVAGITTDFDGETRNASTPDIGGDEFTPAPVDITPSALAGPAAIGCYGASEAVVVTLTNNATAALNFALNPTTVTVTVTKPNATTQAFTVVVNTGTLAAGATRNVTLPGTLDMSAAGTYSFAVVTSTTGDGNTANDNLNATRTVIGVATQPQLVTFTGFTGANLSAVFPGWNEATGATLPTGTTSAWTSTTFPASNTTAKINLYTTGKNDWIVSPKFLATASTVLTFDAGLTDFASNAADPAGMTGTDDFMEVRISTDCGQTFARIPAFAQFNAGNQPSNGSLTNYSINLSSYAGQQIILGFFASEGTVDDAPDYDFHLDNLSVSSPLPIDLAPVALATPTATQGCYSATETVSITVRNLGTQTLDFAVNPATVSATVTTPGGPQTLTATVATGTLAPNATQTVTLAPTLNMTAVGSYSFAITATVTGDQVTANDALPAVTRTVAAPVAGTLAPAASTICISGTAALTLTGAANGSIQYQSSPDNTTFTDISGATSATYTTPVLTTTTYFRAQVRCNAGVATSNVSTITVNTPLVATTNTPISICSGSTTTLTATASAGSNVRFFSAATGGTALPAATAGSYTTPALTASTTYYAEAFTGGAETVGKTTATQTDGGFSGSNTGLVFNATAPLVIQSTTVYNATATAGSVSVELRDNAGTLVATAGPFTVPAGSTTALIPTVLPLNLAVPAAGTYRLVTAATPAPPTLYRDFSGNTYPYTSPSGSVTITGGYLSGASSTYYFFYNLTVSTECASASRTAIQVNVAQPATASFPAATAATCGTSAYQLAGTVGGSATAGTYTSSGTGTFAPNATTLNATYTPSAADVTAGSVTITLTTTAAGPCPTATASLALSISPAPVATFSYPSATTYCAGSTSTVSPTLGTGASAGTFTSTAGLTIDATTGVITLSSSTAGTYIVTNTIAASGPCVATSATATVTIDPATSATFAYAAAAFCQSGSNPAPTVTGTTGGTFSSTTGLSLDATTGAINLGASTPGSYTVTYTVAGACGSSAMASVTITNSLSATFSYPAATTYCAGSTSTVLPTLGAGASAGTFTSTAGLTIDAATGVITLGTSTAGTYTVTNTIAASGACATTSATATVTITPATSATFAYAGTSFCASGTNPTPTVTGTAGGTFTAPAGLSINATTGAISLSASTLGTYTVTYTVAGACGSSATASVTITAGQAATFSYPTATTYCAGSASTVTPTLGTGATAGTFTSTTGLSINATTGVITLSSSTAGTYTVTNTVAASGGCASATATQTVTITPATTATFAYSGSTFCQTGTNPAPTVTGTSGGAFSSATGLSINATTGAINLTGSTVGTYTVTYTVAGACGSSATASITITTGQVATFSYPTTSNCAGSTSPATPTLGTGATAGTFTSTTGLVINATTGAVNLATSTAGTYTVTNTVAAAGGCASATATASITVLPRPATPTLSAAYSGTNTTLTSSATTGNQFYFNGTAIVGATSQTYVVNGTPASLGSYTVTTTTSNGCTSLPSAPIVVSGTKNGIAGASLKLYPNPTPTGQVTLELTGYRLATQLTVLDALGRVVTSELLPANTGTTTHALNLTGVATGVYLLRLSNTDGVETRRLVRE